MSDFKQLINSHFNGKPKIAEVQDQGRGRVIQVFYIGSKEDVGMFDGVDAWIARAASSVSRPDLVKAIQDHLEGNPQAFQATRRRVLVDEPQITRRPTSSTIERRRIHVE